VDGSRSGRGVARLYEGIWLGSGWLGWSLCWFWMFIEICRVGNTTAVEVGIGGVGLSGTPGAEDWRVVGRKLKIRSKFSARR
jgi:hypothetical protein